MYRGNLVPRVFVPYCAWLDKMNVVRFRPLVNGNEDPGYEGDIGGVEKGLYLRKSMSMSLHLAPFIRMPCCDANVLIELAITGSMLIEVLGITSTIVKSSTSLALKFHCLARLLTRTAKSRGASLVPSGIPPRGVTAGEIVLPTDTL